MYKHTDHTVYALRSPVMFHRPKTENARQLPNEHFVESHLLVVNSLMLVKKRTNATYMSSKIGTSTYHAFIFMFVPQMEVSINGGTPEWMVYNRTSYIYIKMDNLGVPPLLGNSIFETTPSMFFGARQFHVVPVLL